MGKKEKKQKKRRKKKKGVGYFLIEVSNEHGVIITKRLNDKDILKKVFG